MTKTFEWLGVDASFAPENLSEKFHATPKQFYQKSALFRLRYTWPFNQLASLLPKKIRSSGLKLAVREVDRDKDAEDLQEAIQFLRPIQLKQTADLSNLLGMTFPDWKTLYDTKINLKDSSKPTLLASVQLRRITATILSMLSQSLRIFN